MVAVVTFMGVICPFFHLRVPKEMKDLQWVEAFHSAIYFYEIVVYLFFFFVVPPETDIRFAGLFPSMSQWFSTTYSVSIHPQALSGTPTQRKKWSCLRQIWNSCHIVLPVGTHESSLYFKCPSPPSDAWKQSTQSWKQANASAIHLNSLFSWGQLYFFIVLLHRDFSPRC